jgi:hypothetical protein
VEQGDRGEHGLLSELGVKKLERAHLRNLLALVEALLHDLDPLAHGAGTALVNEVARRSVSLCRRRGLPCDGSSRT